MAASASTSVGSAESEEGVTTVSAVRTVRCSPPVSSAETVVLRSGRCCATAMMASRIRAWVAASSGTGNAQVSMPAAPAFAMSLPKMRWSVTVPESPT